MFLVRLTAVLYFGLINIALALSDGDIRKISVLSQKQKYEELNSFLWEKSKDHPMATFLLAIAIHKGQGIAKDEKAKAELLAESWSHGFSEAGAAYCILIVAPNLSNDDFSDCLEIVAISGNATAQEAIAMAILTNGESYPKLKAKYHPEILLQNAYKSGSGSAAFALFLRSREDNKTEELSKTELNYLIQAAESLWNTSFYKGHFGQANANLILAYAYLRGNGIRPDLKKYVQHLKVSFDLGNADAACRLAQAYMLGAGVEQDIDQSAKYLSIGKQRSCDDFEKFEYQLKQLGGELNKHDTYEPPKVSANLLNFRAPRRPKGSYDAGNFNSFNNSLYPGRSERRLPPVGKTKGVRCYRTGGTLSTCSDGTYYQHIGNNIFGSNGTSFRKMGNTLLRNDGVSFRKVGSVVYGSDGSVCQTYGSFTNCY
jgi:TPR repeat protein